MSVVKNPKLIEELNELSNEANNIKIPNEDNVVKDLKVIEELNDLEQGNTLKGKIIKSSGAVKDFFSGTKRTEFLDMEEIGSAKMTAGQAAKVGLGLMLVPNQKSQAQIIQSQVPGTDIFKDKYNNLIATLPGGKSFYLNKPGASSQDFLQTTSQILQYIPGYSWALKKAGKSIFKKAILSGAAGASTSIGQDVAAMTLGSKDIDKTRAVISGIVPVFFEGAISPVIGFTWKKLMGNPSFTETIKETIDGKEIAKIVLNKKGKEAAKAAGIDVTKINDKFIKDFSIKLSQGETPEIASRQAGAGKFDFFLSRSQAAGDTEGMAVMIEAAKGSLGKEAQIKAQAFFKQQNIDIETSASNLINRFNKGEFNIESIEEAGQNIIQGLQKKYVSASNEVTTAYNLIDKDGIFQAGNSNIDRLTASVATAIKSATAVIDNTLTPATIRSQKVIKDFVKKYKPKKLEKTEKVKKITPATFNDFIVIKRKLSSLYKTSANNTDRTNVKSIIAEWDKFVDDNVDNILFSNNKNGVEALKKANSLARKKFQLYDINNIKVNGLTINDKAGKAVMKILNDPDITPTKTLDYIFGKAAIGASDDSLVILKRLKTIFNAKGKNLGEIASRNKDFQSLRTAAWERLIRNSSRNQQFNTKTFYNSWKTLTQKNKDLVDELFDVDEVKLIDEFVDEVYKTFTPKDMLNSSNTASALSRLFQTFSRGLTGIVGFNVANIQGLIVSRNIYDRARDVISKKSVSSSIDDQLTPLFGSTASPKTNTAATIAAQNLLERYKTKDADPFSRRR